MGLGESKSFVARADPVSRAVVIQAAQEYRVTLSLDSVKRPHRSTAMAPKAAIAACLLAGLFAVSVTGEEAHTAVLECYERRTIASMDAEGVHVCNL